MTKKKKIILITGILAVIIAAGISTGIYLYINRFDAGEYVQAVLDTSYKNETDQYVEKKYLKIIWISQWRALRVPRCRKRCFPNTENSLGRLPEKSVIL